MEYLKLLQSEFSRSWISNLPHLQLTNYKSAKKPNKQTKKGKRQIKLNKKRQD